MTFAKDIPQRSLAKFGVLERWLDEYDETTSVELQRLVA